MRAPVTTDAKVLAGWPKSKKPVASITVAQALKLTVFQITARLKGMEGRGLVERIAGLWRPTGKEPLPEPVRGPSRVYTAGGGAAGLPDDKKVKTIRAADITWCADLKVIDNLKARLADIKSRIEGRISEERVSPEIERRLRASLRDTAKAIRAQIPKTTKGCWHSEDLWEPSTVKLKSEDGGTVAWRKHVATLYVSPQGHRYVSAGAMDNADLIIINRDKSRTRFKLFEKSHTHRTLTKKEREDEARAEAKLKHKQAERQKRIEAAEQEERERRAAELHAKRNQERHAPLGRKKAHGHKPAGRANSHRRQKRR